jgi:hypothetical protein
MAGPVAALNWAEFVVALLVIAATVYGAFRGVLASIHSGYIYRYVIEPREKAKTAHEQVADVEQKVDRLDEKVEEVGERVELSTDAVIALGESIQNGKQFDVEEFQSRANDRSVDRFLRENDD